MVMIELVIELCSSTYIPAKCFKISQEVFEMKCRYPLSGLLDMVAIMFSLA